MKKEKIMLILEEGRFETECIAFDKNDIIVIQEIYKKWIDLCDLLKSINSREINIPEGLTESLFCIINKNTVRVTGSIKGAKSSFDCFDLTNNSRIQVKASSVKNDLTSFGPKSIWDEIYFMDFYSNGKWNGECSVYLIPNNNIYEMNVNKNQTLTEQQKEGKRPRFSIMEKIIIPKKLKPKYVVNIYEL